jgi:ABC-2 type transport system ATP-binding protein
VIRTEGLTKRYGKITVVHDLNLDVRQGDRYGFLGPNGSGKSTTVRMLLGLVFPSSGRIELIGHRVPRHARPALERVGAIIESPAFWPSLSGRRNLMLRDAAGPGGSKRTRVARIAEALERVGMQNVDERPVKAYSLGMKQRLGIAQALLSPRELLVLDEPTNGLDPQGTREVRSLVRSLTNDGTTVFVSSHLLTEIEQMCTHAAVLSAGRLVAQGTLAELRRAGKARVRVQTPDADAARRVLGRLGLVVEAEDPRRHPTGNETLTATTQDAAPAPEAIVAALVRGGVRVRGFAVDEASLEDRFVELTGEGFDVAE